MLEVLIEKPESTDLATYEVTDDFTNLNAVGIIIIDPSKQRILLVRRLANEFAENGQPIPKEKKNKIDNNGNIILALPSGSGPLSDDPDNPDLAALKEIISETGSRPNSLEKFHAYQQKGAPDSPKVGFYIAQMDMDALNPQSKHKDWPGWFPIDWFGTKIVLPYAEHNQVVLDFIKERLKSNAS
ncbi:MAG: hypothetical protein IT416_02840 [Candidatus Pacebacteria bacterium]|nr:hypothetical protein [Candidatus Paceibacterota bacterium]